MEEVFLLSSAPLSTTSFSIPPHRPGRPRTPPSLAHTRHPRLLLYILSPLVHLGIMSRVTLSALLAVAASTVVFAQPDPPGAVPLADKHFSYPDGVVSNSGILVAAFY